MVYLGGACFFVGILFYASQLHQNLAPENLLSQMTDTYQKSLAESNPDKVISYSGNPTDDGAQFFLKNLPKSFAYGFFGPFAWDVKNIYMAYVALEMMVLMALFVLMFYDFRKSGARTLTALELALIFHIVVLAGILPLVAPNFGTLYRYKVSYLPFLFILVVGNISFAQPWLRAKFERSMFQKKKK